MPPKFFLVGAFVDTKVLKTNHLNDLFGWHDDCDKEAREREMNQDRNQQEQPSEEERWTGS